MASVDLGEVEGRTDLERARSAKLYPAMGSKGSAREVIPFGYIAALSRNLSGESRVHLETLMGPRP